MQATIMATLSSMMLKWGEHVFMGRILGEKGAYLRM